MLMDLGERAQMQSVKTEQPVVVPARGKGHSHALLGSKRQVLSQFTRSYDIVAAVLFCQSSSLMVQEAPVTAQLVLAAAATSMCLGRIWDRRWIHMLRPVFRPLRLQQCAHLLRCHGSGHDRVVAMASGAKIEFANKQGKAARELRNKMKTGHLRGTVLVTCDMFAIISTY